jgi:hypothetical protein
MIQSPKMSPAGFVSGGIARARAASSPRGLRRFKEEAAIRFRRAIDSAPLSNEARAELYWLLSHVDDVTFRLPRLDSIARRLIEDWLHGRIEVGAAADPAAEIFSDQPCRRRAGG